MTDGRVRRILTRRCDTAASRRCDVAASRATDKTRPDQTPCEGLTRWMRCHIRARLSSLANARTVPVLPTSLEDVTALRLAVGTATAGVVLIAPLVLVVGSAGADTPGCVTHAEYRRVHDGMTRGKVHDIFDTTGTSLFENPGVVHNSAREYRMCAAWRAATGDSKVQVQYNNYATHGGPQRVVYKQHY